MNKLDEGLFEFAEQPLKSSLEEFMKEQTLKVLKTEEHHIEYYEKGSSDTLILMIPSSNGHAITYFKYIETLSEQFKVVVPNYEAGVDLKTQCQGFLSLTSKIPHKKLYIFGYSFGGIVAQIMMALKPEVIDGVIFFDSETKTKHIHPKLVKKFVKSYKRLNRTLKYFSVKWMHKSLGKRIGFDVTIGLEENRHFWEALYKQILFETTKERMRLIYDNVREFWMHYEISPEDFNNYRGRILILNLEGSIQRVEVLELGELFKQAEQKTYKEGFRMSLVKCYDALLTDITDFVLEEN